MGGDEGGLNLPSNRKRLALKPTCTSIGLLFHTCYFLCHFRLLLHSFGFIPPGNLIDIGLEHIFQWTDIVCR